MDNLKKTFSTLFIGCIFLTSFKLQAFEKKLFQQQNVIESNFLDEFSSKIKETIQNSHAVPGLDSKEFSYLKTEISQIWENLVQESELKIADTDKNVRPCFVSIQAIIESVLASELQKSVKSLIGVIHTPMPTTPLCTAGEISKELVDSSIENDPIRLSTVKARTTILRDYLFKGGNLLVVYPKKGLAKRTEEQQQIYKQELKNYPKNLVDFPLNCESIPDGLIGATYFFQDESNNTFVFAIKITQAKDPKDKGHFGLLFGPIKNGNIQQHVQSVYNCMGLGELIL